MSLLTNYQLISLLLQFFTLFNQSVCYYSFCITYGTSKQHNTELITHSSMELYKTGTKLVT